jgi:hypothetical protein
MCPPAAASKPEVVGSPPGRADAVAFGAEGVGETQRGTLKRELQRQALEFRLQPVALDVPAGSSVEA